jgi:hypothetical protein
VATRPTCKACFALSMEPALFHREINFEILEVSPLRWRWTIYPKKSSGVGKVAREVSGNRQEAVAKCKLEIDRKLERLHAKGA